MLPRDLTAGSSKYEFYYGYKNNIITIILNFISYTKLKWYNMIRQNMNKVKIYRYSF